MIRAADIVIGQLEVPIETTLEAFRVARAARVRTVLNPAPAGPLIQELLAAAELCVLNELEAEQLSGVPAATLLQIEEAARVLLARGPAVVIVTLGADGALVVEQESAEHVPAIRVDAVDPTGAGQDDAVWPLDFQRPVFFRRRGSTVSDSPGPQGFVAGDFSVMRQLVVEYDASVAGQEALREQYG